jgi:hypothetical protein
MRRSGELSALSPRSRIRSPVLSFPNAHRRPSMQVTGRDAFPKAVPDAGELQLGGLGKHALTGCKLAHESSAARRSGRIPAVLYTTRVLHAAAAHQDRQLVLRHLS